MRLSTVNAIITGGASGLGAATARRLHSMGAKVALLDFNKEMGEAFAAELGEGSMFVRADVTVTEQLQAAINAAMERFGSLNVLVNCAGIGPPARVLSRSGPHDIEQFRRVIAVNLVGTFDATRLAAEKIAHNEPNEEGERGVIISTASIAAYEGQIGQAAYAASKAGIVGLTITVARDLASFGIRVCTIAPGTFETPLLGTLSEESRQSLGKQIPFPSRLGRPEEYATLAQHIIENPMLNGETIRLDGALRMAPK